MPSSEQPPTQIPVAPAAQADALSEPPAKDASIEPIYELAQKRLNSMYLTKGSRFEASRRHKKSNRTATLSIVILSTYIFAISVISLTYKSEISSDWKSILQSVSLIMSFQVVALSLFQSGQRHDLRSELFLKCAQSIDEIWANLCRDAKLRQLTPEKMRDYDDQYRRVVTSYADNHSDIDFHIFRFKTSENPKRQHGFFKQIWTAGRRSYWNWKLHLYVWKNVYIASFFPWAMIFCFFAWRYVLPPILKRFGHIS
jgi:hypothetical protein